MWIPSENLILLDAEMRREEVVETFIHECVEAINTVYDLRLPHHKIQVLGLGLFEMLREAGTLKEK